MIGKMATIYSYILSITQDDRSKLAYIFSITRGGKSALDIIIINRYSWPSHETLTVVSDNKTH